ncbi:uncharacterized protein BYT42DRAFT_551672 [Radiomyces spectabilis]|uniref:uncharacterized protein n=1 Tax=Radiomyces spectabilis TaxID=64574 RepID=UPI00221E5050|nr:uncharacterized protein BYT42DRAFT_551672 [Radiomyces spectabilis]KAI8393615.1 hypothetical protein BYT42DRAFT_551672 [Radiomyces spectabilis]
MKWGNSSFCITNFFPIVCFRRSSLSEMDRLPLEVVLQILVKISLSSFTQLYTVFPAKLVDEALRIKLRQHPEPLLHLVSTNLHELLAVKHTWTGKKNESIMPLHYKTLDTKYRLIWLLPDFESAQHCFKVKDTYVSHGKLVLRGTHDRSLVSLGDIRKCFPPVRGGTFSGASDYPLKRSQIQEMTIQQHGCLLDASLVHIVPRIPEPSCVPLVNTDDKLFPPRPLLPSFYKRQRPLISHTDRSLWQPTYPDPTCGYFLVERLGISIEGFLELFS